MKKRFNNLKELRNNIPENMVSFSVTQDEHRWYYNYLRDMTPGEITKYNPTLKLLFRGTELIINENTKSAE